jgi:hypothetical protein
MKFVFNSNNDITRYYLMILYFISIFLLVRLVIPLGTDLTYVLFIGSISSFIVLYKWPNYPKTMLFLFFTLIIIKIFSYTFIEPLAGPDEIRYHQLLSTFPSWIDFLLYFWNDISTNFFAANSFTMFGFIYFPFFELIGSKDPLIIVTLNTLLFIGSIYLVHLMNIKHFKFEVKNKFFILVIGLAFLSPSLLYWSSTFAKDVFALFLALMSVYLLLNKNFFWFSITLLFATALRPYSIVIVFCYYILYKKMHRTGFVVLIGSIIYTIYKIGFVGAINITSMIGYLYLTPNPFDRQNWIDLPFLAFESLLMGVFFCLTVIISFVKKSTREFFFLIFLGVSIYACALTVVGQFTIVSRSLEYGLFDAGDNILRKKIPMLPLFFIAISYLLSHKQSRTDLK